MAEYNYIQTIELMDAINKLCNIDAVKVSMENTDWRGKKYKSDVVTLELEHNIGFEVLENEIIVFYFKDHTHFEDYSSDLDADEPDYVARAIEFLVNLFTSKIRIEEYYTKDKLVRDRFYFILPDGDEYIGGTFYKFWTAILCKKKLQKKIHVWAYNKITKRFEEE